MKDVFFAGDDEDSPQQWSRGRIYFGILDDEEYVPPVVGRVLRKMFMLFSVEMKMTTLGRGGSAEDRVPRPRRGGG